MDKPYEKVDLRTYVGWQAEPTYPRMEEAMAAMFAVIQPIDAPPPKETEKKAHKASTQGVVGKVFGSLKGRFAKVLVDFWTGAYNPPDSLNAAIILTARMLPYYFQEAEEAVDFVEGLIDRLPDVAFCDRLTNGRRREVSSEVRRAVEIAFAGNGHQGDAALSKEKLDKVFQAWQRKGFSLVDRSTWGISSAFTSQRESEHCAWTAEELHALAYFATILNTDLQTTADATRQLLCLLANHPTGVMSVPYVRNHLLSFGIKCKKHGKVNEYINSLAQAGWIEQVSGYVVKRRGRQWRIGPHMEHRLADNSSTDITNLPPIYYLCPLIDANSVINVENDVSEEELALAMRHSERQMAISTA